MGISAILPSKDRACQLELLLRSIHVNCPHDLFNNIFVLYKASNNDFEKAYQILQDKIEEIFSNDTIVQFCPEHNFMDDFRFTLGCICQDDEFVCGLVDDLVIYSPIKISKEELQSGFDDDVLCYSLRLGYNTIVQNYADGSLQRPLQAEKISENIIKWNWKNRFAMENYGYPISLDGHIYRSIELLHLSTIKPFTCLRQWEGELATQVRHLTTRNSMLASPSSSLISIANNCVQNPPMIAGLHYPFDPAVLNKMFLDGFIIDLKSITKRSFNSSHIELPFQFINGN